MVAKRTHGLSKKPRLAFLPLLANRSVNTESIRSVANSVGQGVGSLSTSQIRLDLEKGEKILFDDDVAREINLPLQDGSTSPGRLPGRRAFYENTRPRRQRCGECFLRAQTPLIAHGV